MYNMETKQSEIDITKLLNALKKQIGIIVFMGIFVMLISSVLAWLFIQPKYSSSIDILVNQKNNNTAVQYNIQQADLQAINTYKMF